MIESVLFLHQVGGGSGGAERYLELLGSSLLLRNVRADLVVFGGDPAVGQSITTSLRRSFASADHVPGPARPGAVRHAIRTHRPDVLHWNFNDPFAFSGGLWPAMPWGVPSVITDHLPMMRAGLHREVPRALLNGVVGAVIVVGPAADVAARQHWRWLPRLCAIPNGVPQRSRVARSDLGYDRRLRLVFVGRLEPQKDPGFALEVTSALVESGHDVGLRLVGEGTLRTSLESSARSLGVADRVDFVGFCDDPGPALDEADLLLSPSRFEGAPLVPREALASALPVVLSDIAAHRELLEGCVLLRTAPLDDVQAWVRAIDAVAENLSSASLEAIAAADRLPLDFMVDQTIECYRSARARQRRGARR